jgi:predicted dehydrogenase
MGQPLRVGIIGCGKIIGQYLETFARITDIKLVAVADLDQARATEVASSQSGVVALTVESLLGRSDIEAVVNLTIPSAHTDVSLAAIAAGKAVYVEKPLADTVENGSRVLAAAAAAGVPLGCAPDTVLGTGTQTARRAIDDGMVGTPISASATMVTPGHERWHPNPDFYYQPGGGPLLDMGPYYVTALVSLLGPVTKVIGAASALRDTRTVQTGSRAGELIPVTTATHVTGVLHHANGTLSTLLMSFDATATKASRIEVHGTTGTLSIPDPNNFSGDVQLWRSGAEAWETLPASAGYTRAARGYGLAEMLWNAEHGATRLANTTADGQLALHVLEIMEAVLTAADSGTAIELATTTDRPHAVPLSGR